MPKLTIAACALAAAALLTIPASAAIYDITLKGAKGDATFSIDTAKAAPTALGLQEFFHDVSGVYNGVSQSADVSFGTLSFIADFEITGTTLGLSGFEQFSGPILVNAPFDAPSLATGTFALASILSGPATITITAVPEASTWAALAIGFAALGALARGHRRSAAAASPA